MQPAYAHLLELAREQHEAAERDDLDTAVALLPSRARVIASLPKARRDDAEAIAEVLRLDRDLSSRIREHMIGIRNEALGGQHGRIALSGYRPLLRHTALAIDTTL